MKIERVMYSVTVLSVAGGRVFCATPPHLFATAAEAVVAADRINRLYEPEVVPVRVCVEVLE